MPVSKRPRKKKKKTAARAKGKKAAGSSGSSKLLHFPGRSAVENAMVYGAGLAGHSPGRDDALMQAQDLIYDAWEARSKRDRVRMAKKALALSELCADAHALLAEEAGGNLLEVRRHYEAGVAAGQAALGADVFEKDMGHFWGILETRPYMRARSGLAQVLWDLGERAAAVAHLKEMLQLNPNDNQGTRCILAGWLLRIWDHDALETLLLAYEGDISVEMVYSRTLLAFRLRGASDEARSQLGFAWNCNPFVPDLLTGALKAPRRLADSFALGSEEEAAYYVVYNAENWAATEGAICWLADAASNLPQPDLSF